jgi:hypothetical protein
MRRAILLPIYLVLLAVVVGLALAVRSGLEARERPLAGRWAAEFRLDSIKSSFADGRASPPAREAAGQVDLRAGPTRYPRLNGVPWRPSFVGRHAVDFAAVLGQNGSAPSEAVAIRFGADSAEVYLNGICCDAGGVIGRGRITGDSVTGLWTADSDGWAAWGHFILRRLPRRSASM